MCFLKGEQGEAGGKKKDPETTAKPLLSRCPAGLLIRLSAVGAALALRARAREQLNMAPTRAAPVPRSCQADSRGVGAAGRARAGQTPRTTAWQAGHVHRHRDVSSGPTMKKKLAQALLLGVISNTQQDKGNPASPEDSFS